MYHNKFCEKNIFEMYTVSVLISIQNSGYLFLNICASIIQVKMHVQNFSLALSSANSMGPKVLRFRHILDTSDLLCMHKAMCATCALLDMIGHEWTSEVVIWLGSPGVLNKSAKALFPAQTNEKSKWIYWKLSSRCYWKIHAKNEYFVSLKSHFWLVVVDCLAVAK